MEVKKEVSAGSLLTLVTVLVAGGIAWGTLSSKAGQNADNIQTNKEAIKEIRKAEEEDSRRLQDIRVDSATTKTRLQAVEKELDEQGDNIKEILRLLRR